MKTLFVSDLDGTLLTSKERLSDFTVSAVNSLVRRGFIFSYATARSSITATKVTTGFCSRYPVIVYNGAFIIDIATQEILLSNYFLKPEIEFIRQVLHEYNIHPIVYAYIDGKERFSFYTGHTNYGQQYFLDSRKDDIRRTEKTSPGDVYQGDIFYFSCIGIEEELAPLNDIFKSDSRFYCVNHKDIYSGAPWLELLPAKATKANAILRLKALLSCDRIVSFGDGKNDIPMFEISDECYAVANAHPDLKERATAVIGTNDSDGVARWLLENVL
jgi:Cof subfamily protein (haloacid dehalogenase superfamily)